MNRDIIFRGKTITNEWKYGYLFKGKDENNTTYSVILTQKRFTEDSNTNENMPFGFYEDEVSVINPETESQFTGLYDKNKVKIFEGDIIQKIYTNHVEVFICEWVDKYACFAFKENKKYGEYYYFQKCDEDKLLVIGNIWDSKYLVK